MRTKKETVSIRIDKKLKDEIVNDRDELQRKSHTNGRWSLSDCISELRRIAKLTMNK